MFDLVEVEGRCVGSVLRQLCAGQNTNTEGTLKELDLGALRLMILLVF